MTQKNSTQKYFFFIFSKKTIFFFFFEKYYFFLSAKAVPYLVSSQTDTQRSHLGQRQFVTLMSLLVLRKFKVKGAYYQHHQDHHHHHDHYQNSKKKQFKNYYFSFMYTTNPESEIPNHATHVIETNVLFRLVYSVVLPEHTSVCA